MYDEINKLIYLFNHMLILLQLIMTILLLVQITIRLF